MKRAVALTFILLIVLSTLAFQTAPASGKPPAGRGRRGRFGFGVSNGVLRITHRSGDVLELQFPLQCKGVEEKVIDRYTKLVVADYGSIEMRFHVSELSPTIKFDIYAKQDVELTWGQFQRTVRSGKWRIDWGDLEKYVTTQPKGRGKGKGGQKKIVLPAGTLIDPLISYEESTGTYVFDSPDDFAPCVLVNSPNDGSVLLKTPDDWYSGTILPDWAILTHCSWTHNEEEKYYEFEFIVENKGEEYGDVYVLYDEESGFWTKNGYATISDETNIVYSGTLATRVEAILNDTKNWGGVQKSLTTPIDISQYDFAIVHLYIVDYTGSGNPYFKFYLQSDNLNWSKWITETLSSFEKGKWYTIVFPLRIPTIQDTYFDYTSVFHIEIYFHPSTDTNITFILDRVVFVKASWTYIEVYLPDGGFVSNIWVWNVTAGAWLSVWGSPDKVVTLWDGTKSFNDIYGGSYGLTISIPCERGNNASAWDWGDTSPALVNASTTYGTLKRQLIALKIPPYSELNDLNKIRLKIRISYTGLNNDGQEYLVLKLENVYIAGNDTVVPQLYALYFNGENAYVDCGNIEALNGVSEITVEALVYQQEGSTGGREIASKRDVWELGTGWTTDGHPQFWIKDTADRWYGSGEGTTDIRGGLHILHGIYDGQFLKIYVDGDLENSNNIGSVDVDSTTYSVWLGERDGFTERWWHGLIALVRIYNRALSESEMESSVVNGSGLVLYLSADFYNGTHLINLVNASLSGTIYGNAFRVPVDNPKIYLVKNIRTDNYVHFEWFPSGTTIEIYDSSGSLAQSFTVSSNDHTISLSSGNYTIVAKIKKADIGRAITYRLDSLQCELVSSLFVQYFDDSINVAPKLPPREKAVWLLHYAYGTNITFYFHGTGIMVSHVVVDGEEIASAIIPKEYLQSNRTIDVYLVEEPSAPVVLDLTQGNLTVAKWYSAEKRLYVTVERLYKGDVVVVVYSPSKPKAVWRVYSSQPEMLREFSAKEDLDSATNCWYYDQGEKKIYIKVRVGSEVPVIADWEKLEGDVWVPFNDTGGYFRFGRTVYFDQALLYGDKATFKRLKVGTAVIREWTVGAKNCRVWAEKWFENRRAVFVCEGNDSDSVFYFSSPYNTDPTSVVRLDSGTELRRVSTPRDVERTPDSWCYRDNMVYIHVKHFSGNTTKIEVSFKPPPKTPKPLKAKPPTLVERLVRSVHSFLRRLAEAFVKWLRSILG